MVLIKDHVVRTETITTQSIHSKNTHKGVFNMKFFTTRSFRPLLALLILLSLLKSFAVGKALLPNTTSTSHKSKAPDCLVPVEPGFPQSVNINISISSTSQAARVVHDASKRSTSPWDYSINEDPNRFPARIAEATCRHVGCVDAAGQEYHSMSSVPILQEILVLRRQYRGCKQTYQLEKQWVTVGCTCARPSLL